MADDSLNHGLHKSISTIFDGVQVPRNDDIRQTSHANTPQQTSHTDAPSQTSHTDAPSQTENTSSATAVAAPPVESSAPAQPSVQKQPVQSPKKAAPVDSPKINSSPKIANQAPWKRALESIKNKLASNSEGESASARQIATKALVPILFIVMIIAFTTVLKKPVRTQNHLTDTVAAGSAAELTVETDWEIPELYPDTMRDPMQFGSASAGQDNAGMPIVRGILYSEDNPAAIIDGQIIHVGEKIWGATITKISSNSVEFKTKKKTWVQKVQQ